MEIITLDFKDEARLEAQLNEAAAFLRAGKTIIYPTDTVYGLGCDALNEAAVLKVNRIKEWKGEKPLSIIVRDLEEMKKYCFLGARNKRAMEKLLPGRFTFILPGAKNVPAAVTAGKDTIGFRIPAHPLTISLAYLFPNPIVTTSVNREGEEPLNDPFKIVEYFRDQKEAPDLVLDGGKLANPHPSVIVDISSAHPRIVRSGKLGVQETLELLEKLSKLE
jgi:tRNA threonylcarbamoyl adenosine modification protein (Sua5/YciO/YrdC/YwlC family)